MTSTQPASPELDGNQIAATLGIAPADVLQASAKTGLGVEEVLRAIVARVPPPGLLGPGTLDVRQPQRLGQRQQALALSARQHDPEDAWHGHVPTLLAGRLRQQALDNAPPSPADNFRWRFFGLFYVAPNQNSYMCRLRMPNGILAHWQFAGVGDLAEHLGLATDSDLADRAVQHLFVRLGQLTAERRAAVGAECFHHCSSGVGNAVSRFEEHHRARFAGERLQLILAFAGFAAEKSFETEPVRRQTTQCQSHRGGAGRSRGFH